MAYALPQAYHRPLYSKIEVRHSFVSSSIGISDLNTVEAPRHMNGSKAPRAARPQVETPPSSRHRKALPALTLGTMHHNTTMRVV